MRVPPGCRKAPLRPPPRSPSRLLGCGAQRGWGDAWGGALSRCAPGSGCSPGAGRAARAGHRHCPPLLGLRGRQVGPGAGRTGSCTPAQFLGGQLRAGPDSAASRDADAGAGRCAATSLPGCECALHGSSKNRAEMPRCPPVRAQRGPRTRGAVEVVRPGPSPHPLNSASPRCPPLASRRRRGLPQADPQRARGCGSSRGCRKLGAHRASGCKAAGPRGAGTLPPAGGAQLRGGRSSDERLQIWRLCGQ